MFQNDIKNLQEFINFFLETYKDLVDVEFDHLNEGSVQIIDYNEPYIHIVQWAYFGVANPDN